MIKFDLEFGHHPSFCVGWNLKLNFSLVDGDLNPIGDAIMWFDQDRNRYMHDEVASMEQNHHFKVSQQKYNKLSSLVITWYASKNIHSS